MFSGASVIKNRISTLELSIPFETPEEIYVVSLQMVHYGNRSLRSLLNL